jgi:hypothetical protein
MQASKQASSEIKTGFFIEAKLRVEGLEHVEVEM